MVQSFQKTEFRHGMRYMRIIGDGDSSGFARIREDVQIRGRYVEKRRCAYHTCKCYRSNLERLVAKHPYRKEGTTLQRPPCSPSLDSNSKCDQKRSTELKENEAIRSQPVQQL